VPWTTVDTETNTIGTVIWHDTVQYGNLPEALYMQQTWTWCCVLLICTGWVYAKFLGCPLLGSLLKDIASTDALKTAGHPKALKAVPGLKARVGSKRKHPTGIVTDEHTEVTWGLAVC
jgi:hypothetical protein